MPEGPEVQVIVDGLRKFEGQTIQGVSVTPERPWILDKHFPQRIGDKILHVTRRGKFILIEHESSGYTVVHLSFTGMFLDSPKEFLALKFFMDSGEVLYFHDKRGLSRWRCMTPEEVLKDQTLSKHGIDGLTSTVQEISARLHKLQERPRRTELKPFLLDYHNICGIGNIYGSEICFASKLSPFVSFSALTEEELQRLSIAIPLVLRRAYSAGGSSVEDFNDVRGVRGKAQELHKVYNQLICQECGGPIVQVKQAGRSTYYCPKCQGVKV